jgi:hypothetical protein
MTEVTLRPLVDADPDAIFARMQDPEAAGRSTRRTTRPGARR